MPDLLILSPNHEQSESVTRLATAEDFRTKTSQDIDTAKKWLTTKSFDFFVVHEVFGEKTIENLALILWSTNSGAQVVVYGSDEVADDSRAKKKWAFGIQGYNYFAGKNTASLIAQEFKKFAQQKTRAASGRKVIVVEDLDAARDIICSFVEHLENVKVEGVASGQEALSKLLEQPGDYFCVITDINMPGMTGAELTERIRANEKTKHIPVVALTAYGTPDVLLKCLAAGASGFLVKPPSKINLSRELGRAKRLIAAKDDPRLIQASDVAAMREILEEKGYI